MRLQPDQDSCFVTVVTSWGVVRVSETDIMNAFSWNRLDHTASCGEAALKSCEELATEIALKRIREMQ